MSDRLTACGKEYRLIRLLGHGKGGYSYLAECDGCLVVLKQIHHEPCDYYTFGNKIEAECRDYQQLKDAGIRIPAMLAVDTGSERIIKEYIEGDTVFDYVRNGVSVEPYLPQVREMAVQARSHGLNIDYFPTNFVVRDGRIWYIDYECNDYTDEWNFDNWGIRYWSRTPEFEEYLLKSKNIMKIETIRLMIYPAAREQMEAFIAGETDAELKKAYTEMLEGCLQNPDQWEWYAMWMIELLDGTHIGDLCFKGLDANGAVEIGYGILEEYRGQGYAAEAVDAAVIWALNQPDVTRVEAETEPDNHASQRVLEKCGFLPTGTFGEEGPRFFRTASE